MPQNPNIDQVIAVLIEECVEAPSHSTKLKLVIRASLVCGKVGAVPLPVSDAIEHYGSGCVR